MSGIVYEVVVAAAGDGTRFGADKLTALLGDKTVVERAVAPFLSDPFCRRVLVMAGKNIGALRLLFANELKVTVAVGGATRRQTVALGVALITAEHVLVHDGARPFLSADLLAEVVGSLSRADAVLPVINPVDSVLQVVTITYLERSDLRLVQTPQGFRTARLQDALSRADRLGTATAGDEGSLYVAAFGPRSVVLVAGDTLNRKITNPSDLALTL